jgi:hypothetical protein
MMVLVGIMGHNCAYEGLPSAESDLLMAWASLSLSPVAPLLSTRSEPARSTRFRDPNSPANIAHLSHTQLTATDGPDTDTRLHLLQHEVYCICHAHVQVRVCVSQGGVTLLGAVAEGTCACDAQLEHSVRARRPLVHVRALLHQHTNTPRPSALVLLAHVLAQVH